MAYSEACGNVEPVNNINFIALSIDMENPRQLSGDLDLSENGF